MPHDNVALFYYKLLVNTNETGKLLPLAQMPLT